METFKKIFTIVSLSLSAFVIIMGIYSTINMYVENAYIEKEGLETIGTIQTKWRGTCGSGSGNSVTFKVIIRGFDREFIHRCGVSDEVQIGDMYMVKYLKDDPTKNIIFFDRKVFN